MYILYIAAIPSETLLHERARSRTSVKRVLKWRRVTIRVVLYDENIHDFKPRVFLPACRMWCLNVHIDIIEITLIITPYMRLCVDEIHTRNIEDRIWSNRVGFCGPRRERIRLEKQKERRKRLQIIEAGRGCTQTHAHTHTRVNKKDTRFPRFFRFLSFEIKNTSINRECELAFSRLIVVKDSLSER